VGHPGDGVDPVLDAADDLAFLFGLSMDYEIFILARMRDEYDRTGSTSTAVVQASAERGGS
jgi:putative drug exporter of the RND superfamily